MSWGDLIWFPPIMLGVAMVLGSAGTESPRKLPGSILHAFVALSIGVVGVGIVIHLIAHFFSG